MKTGAFSPRVWLAVLWLTAASFNTWTHAADGPLPITVLSFGKEWRYWNASSGGPGENWAQLGFDDSKWLVGAGQLGYGDGDEKTVTRTNAPPHPITSYFRRTLMLESHPYTALRLRLVRDDGAVVYINGKPVFRSNLPDGAITPETRALTAIGADLENTPVVASIPPTILVSGTNVVAVEVHQNAPESSDLSFDLELSASLEALARIEITSPKEGDVFPFGKEIPIVAVAMDPNGYIPRLEFFAGDRRIGVSEIAFFRPPDPGTPITHTFVWTNAPSGTNALTARGVDSRGQGVISQRVKIVVGASENKPPKAFLVQPKDGAVFESGNIIEVRAEAADADGKIERLDIFADDLLLGSTKLGTVTLTWTNPPAGKHTLIARAVDDRGTEGRSTPVRILVEPPQGLSLIAERELPDGYTPGVPFLVHVVVRPASGTLAYAVEDRPPQGWGVSEISHSGAFDSLTGKVKFGPFTDSEPRTLTYRVTPPTNAEGRYVFEGTASAAGTPTPVGGDQAIERARNTHPADTNSDNRITLNEVTSYAAAWKGGQSWILGPNPIPLSYVTRAGLLWKQGEVYHFDSTQPAPLCWVTDRIEVKLLSETATSAAPQRVVSASDVEGKKNCSISITPEPGTRSYAIEERVSVGRIVTDINENGAFDPATGTIRWGPFMDDLPREFHYSLSGAEVVVEPRGIVSFDGETNVAIHARPLRIPSVDRKDGALHLRIEGIDGLVCVIEKSSDLKTWSELEKRFLPGGELDYAAPGTSSDRQTYYRVKSR